MDDTEKLSPLLLPAPESNPDLESSGTGATKLHLDSTTVQTVKLDELGPLVVNSDGTLSRIANWQNMTEAERERTLRVLSARNKARLANEEKKLREQGSPEAGEAVSVLGSASE